jgi:hypothetical protein
MLSSLCLPLYPVTTTDLYTQNDLQSKKSIFTSAKPTSGQQQGVNSFPCCHALSQQWLGFAYQDRTRRQSDV